MFADLFSTEFKRKTNNTKLIQITVYVKKKNIIKNPYFKQGLQMLKIK